LHDGQIGCLDKILFDFRINPSLRTSSEVPIFHMVHPLLLLFMLFNGLFQFFFLCILIVFAPNCGVASAVLPSCFCIHGGDFTKKGILWPVILSGKIRYAI